MSRTCAMNRALAAALLCAGLVGAAACPTGATPSTNFWAPSTPAVQPFGVLHVTYDTYFGSKAAYPIDAGLTIGLLPGSSLQAEAGFDLFYPTYSGGKGVEFPLVLNAKLGAPEDAWFKGQPAWSVGFFGLGFEKDVNDQNALYGVLGKTIPGLGSAQFGAYYGLNERLFRSADGADERFGLLAGYVSPAIDVPVIDRIVFTWDIQSGHNALGATGGGAYFYVTPSVDLLTGPVFFFERDLQPGGSSWMWSLQLDVDLDLRPGGQ